MSGDVGVKIVEYKLLSHFTGAEVSSQVNTHLKDGFELYGNPVVVPAGEGFICAQAVVRKDEEPV